MTIQTSEPSSFDPAFGRDRRAVEARALAVNRSRVKQVAETGLALLAILALSPILVLVALAIRLDSPGPIIYRQLRYGRNGMVFSIFKFRTMTAQASRQAFRQAERDDKRITRVGQFLRRTNLDELPQLFNVLFGQMALIGPRPHPVALDQHYAGTIEHYMARYAVKPGITGWAQVNGHRGETRTRAQMEARVQHDLEYIENWSLRLDMLILARTVFHPRAYENAF